MVFKLKYIKGIMPCKHCKIDNHSRCYKLEHCSCNCPFQVQWKGRTNQNRKKTHCIRGHEYNLENTRVYLTPSGRQHRLCHQCQVIKRELNREKIKITARKSYHKHKNEYRLLRRIGAKKYLEQVKQTVLTYYGNGNLICVCCGEKEIRFLTIDHIIEIGGKNRSQRGERGHNLYRYLIKNKFPSGYQTLCFNCNCGRAHNKGVCPHKERLAELTLVVKEGEGQFLN